MSILSDAIKENISILDYAVRSGYTLVKIGRQYSLQEHDSIRIDPEKNVFFRHSTGRGGSVIDFAMMLSGLSKDEAIRELRAALEPSALRDFPNPGKHDRSSKPKPVAAPVPFVLPEKTDGRFSRIYAYLGKTRAIDNTIISDMVNRKQLYEDKRHNCVFVGYDKEKAAAFGCVRGTHTEKTYRGDVPGSRKEVGFYVNNGAPALFVVEAPIDAMSIMTLLKRNRLNYKKFDYLAIGGMCHETIPYHLSRLPEGQLKRIYLAVDNDAKGEMARIAYREKLAELGFAGEIIDKLPKGKDWNEDLCAAFPTKPQAPPKGIMIERG